MDSKIAISIKTFYREQALFDCISSIEEYCNVPYKLYIADDGPISKKKEDLYDKLKAEDHVIITLPFNSGASLGRNRIVERLENEKYLLRLEDDYLFTDRTDIQLLIQILEQNDTIGVVSQKEIRYKAKNKKVIRYIIDEQGFFRIHNNELNKRIVSQRELNYLENGKIKFAYVDWAMNFLLIKRKVFNEILWDNKLKFFSEHIDFMLQIFFSSYKMAFTTCSVHYHNKAIRMIEEDEYRDICRRNFSYKKESENYLFKKWNIIRVRTTYSLRANLDRISKIVLVKLKSII